MRVDESMYYSHDYDMILRLARTNEGVFIDDPVLYQRKHLSYRRPSASGRLSSIRWENGSSMTRSSSRSSIGASSVISTTLLTGRSCSIPR
jgi:hypothetical protein